MPRLTIQERLIKALENQGFEIDTNHRTTKYTVMRPINKDHKLAKNYLESYGHDCRFFVGKSGALRFSRAGTSTTSIPHDSTKGRLLATVSVDGSMVPV